MTFNYSASQATATRLLTKFGRNVTRHAYTVGAYDPSTGSATATATDSTRIAAVLDYSDQSRSGERYVRGNLVIASDKKLLLDGTGPATVTDEYTVGSERYSVVSVKELNPAGTSVMYEIHARLL